MWMDFSTNRQIFCYRCNKFTNTCEPIVINRTLNNKLKISGICCDCNLAKSKFISSEIRRLLPYDLVFNTDSHRTFINNIETFNKKIMPIFPMVDKIINV
jgi:hypothetical protein